MSLKKDIGQQLITRTSWTTKKELRKLLKEELDTDEWDTGNQWFGCGREHYLSCFIIAKRAIEHPILMTIELVIDLKGSVTFYFFFFSQLSLNGQLYKIDTSLKQTIRLVSAVFISIPYIETLYKTDSSIRHTTITYLW